MAEAPNERHSLLHADQIDTTPVYPIIHMIHQDMLHFIDTPLTFEALLAPDLTYTLIKPLEDKYALIQRKGNSAVVFCFLLNRFHFVNDQNLVTVPLSRTRAALCEILAIRTLREYGENTLQLVQITTTSWPVYSGADDEALKRCMEELNLDVDDLEHYIGNALELAIIGRAKRFLKSSACQKIIDSIYSGKCVYQAQSNHSILADTYKRTPIHFYDPHKAPLLDHYRLKVPAVRMVLEYMNFLILFVLFVLTLELNQRDHLVGAEIAFMIYALGFALEKIAAMHEHGLRVYVTGTWNGFDLAFITIFASYASLRLYGFRNDDQWARAAGLNCLAVAACLIFPRLAFVTLRNNLMVLSLRAMIVQFAILMFIAVFCFAGFLYALWTLSRNKAGYSAGDIAWWMADLWFGLDATGFQLASTFHEVFGPLLMVTYACLSNTLLLTVLVSILSHTFSTISEDALAEAMYRRAVSTLEGVKSDVLFSYQPPINLVALLIMLPARLVLSPRWFHKVNVFMIRTTSFPILLTITIYERQSKQLQTTTFRETISVTAERIFDALPKPFKRISIFEGLFAGNSADIELIFELEEEMINNAGSALDMGDLEVSTTKDNSANRQRRLSQATNRRTSTQSSHAVNIPQSRSPSRSRMSTSPSQDGLGVRGRLHSVVHHAADVGSTVMSPLAQFYRPLKVDDDLVEEGTSPAQAAALAPAPMARRRLSSMHRFPPPEIHSFPTAPRRFPTTSTRGYGVGDMTLPESPPAKEEEAPKPEPVGQIIEAEESEGASSGTLAQLTHRLQDMEERHKRIEDILVQLTLSIRSLGNHDQAKHSP